MHDTDIKDIVLDITLESPTREKNEIKEVCRIKFGPLLREQFTTFHVDLMDAHSKDVYISNDEMKGHPVTAAAYKPKPPVEALQTKTALDSSKGGLVTIEQEIEFQCNLKDLFDVLVDKQKVQLWTRAPAEISIEKDAKLVLFGGNITGNMIALVPNEKIEMSWRLKTWPEKHFSNVLITFQEKKDCTVLKLVQSKVPVGERDATEANWRNYYWNSIKRTFGYGSIL
jgi:activator of HSP90 ATPase